MARRCCCLMSKLGPCALNRLAAWMLSALKEPWHKPIDSWVLRCFGCASAGGASNSGGAVLRSFFTDEQLAALTAQIDIAKPPGLGYYPLPKAGERFPVNDPQLQPRLTPRPDSDAEFVHGCASHLPGCTFSGSIQVTCLVAPFQVQSKPQNTGVLKWTMLTKCQHH